MPKPGRALATRPRNERRCQSCGKTRRLIDFGFSDEYCRFCVGPDGNLSAVVGLAQAKAQHALADQLRQIVEKQNPDAPEVMEAIVKRLGGRDAIGEMIANDILASRGSLRDDGTIRTEAERLKDPYARASDKRLVLRMWEFFSRLMLDNDEAKKAETWTDGLDLDVLKGEFNGILLEALQQDERLLRQVFMTCVRSPSLEPGVRKLVEQVVAGQPVDADVIEAEFEVVSDERGHSSEDGESGPEESPDGPADG